MRKLNYFLSAFSRVLLVTTLIELFWDREDQPLNDRVGFNIAIVALVVLLLVVISMLIQTAKQK